MPFKLFLIRLSINHTLLVINVSEKLINYYFLFFQNTVKDFAARSIGILQESMRWAPNAVRSHLMQYLLQMDNSTSGMLQHSGLALATESVLNYAGYNRNSASLGVGLKKYENL